MFYCSQLEFLSRFGLHCGLFLQDNHEEFQFNKVVGSVSQLQAPQYWSAISVHRVACQDALCPWLRCQDGPSTLWINRPIRSHLPGCRMLKPCGCSVLCGTWRWPVTPYPFPASNLNHEWLRPPAVAIETASLTWNVALQHYWGFHSSFRRVESIN